VLPVVPCCNVVSTLVHTLQDQQLSLWTLEYSIPRLRRHPEGPKICQQDEVESEVVVEVALATRLAKIWNANLEKYATTLNKQVTLATP
jgi:hypothetical protein